MSNAAGLEIRSGVFARLSNFTIQLTTQRPRQLLVYTIACSTIMRLAVAATVGSDYNEAYFISAARHSQVPSARKKYSPSFSMRHFPISNCDETTGAGDGVAVKSRSDASNVALMGPNENSNQKLGLIK